jgi:DNA-binding protein HU-beta
MMCGHQGVDVGSLALKNLYQERNDRMATAAKKPMSKTQLVALVAEKTGISKKQAVQALELLADTAYKEAKKAGFTLPGLGKLVVVKRKARMGRNPATGETIKIPAKTVVKFRVAKACKDAIVPGK